jgi:hypothetical protein
LSVRLTNSAELSLIPPPPSRSLVCPSAVYPHLYAHSLEGENVDSFKEVFRLAEDKGEKASWAPELEKLKVEGWFV